jgi:hypothetical protein
VFEAYKQWKLFSSTPITRYFGFSVGSDCLWLEKDVSLNVDISLLIPHEAIESEDFSNLCKKQISCKDRFVCLSLHFGDSIDDDVVDKMEKALEDELETHSYDDGRERS